MEMIERRGFISARERYLASKPCPRYASRSASNRSPAMLPRQHSSNWLAAPPSFSRSVKLPGRYRAGPWLADTFLLSYLALLSQLGSSTITESARFCCRITSTTPAKTINTAPEISRRPKGSSSSIAAEPTPTSTSASNSMPTRPGLNRVAGQIVDQVIGSIRSAMIAIHKPAACRVSIAGALSSYPGHPAAKTPAERHEQRAHRESDDFFQHHARAGIQKRTQNTAPNASVTFGNRSRRGAGIQAPRRPTLRC